MIIKALQRCRAFFMKVIILKILNLYNMQNCSAYSPEMDV